MSKKLPKFMTKGGPGDKDFKISKLGGKVDTSEWFENQLETDRWSYTEGILDKGTIAQQSKDQEIFFCDIPFTQVYIEMGGNYAACCFGAEANGKDGLPNHNVLNTTLEEWMRDSTYMNDIRSEMLDPNSEYKMVNKTCKRCIKDEARYGRSRRTACMKIHTQEPDYWEMIDRSAQLFLATGKWEFEYRMLEVQLKVYGSECNLDCYMCLHDNSTIRQKVAIEGNVWNDEIFGKTSLKQFENRMEWIAQDKTSIINSPLVKTLADGSKVIPIQNVDYTITNKESMIDQTVGLAPYIRSIKIIGGEPLIMKKHYELLDRLIAIDEAKHITIKYQTNLTETKAGKHNIFNYIPEFRKVSMVASVDGIGKTIEYMRRRCSWDRIVNNAEICNTYDNVDVDFNGLVSFLSVMRFYEVIDWCLENPIIDQINWAMLETPVLLRVNNLPEKIKKDLIPKYERWPDIQAALKMPAETDFYHEGELYADIDINNVLDYLLDTDEYYKGTKWEMNLFEVFPELEEFYTPKENRARPNIGLEREPKFMFPSDYE